MGLSSLVGALCRVLWFTLIKANLAEQSHFGSEDDSALIRKIPGNTMSNLCTIMGEIELKCSDAGQTFNVNANRLCFGIESAQLSRNG